MLEDPSRLPAIDPSGMPTNRPNLLLSVLSPDSNGSPSPMALTEIQELFREYSELRALEEASPETRKEILAMARSRQRNDHWVQKATALFPFADVAARVVVIAAIIAFAWHLAETGHDWLAGVALGSTGLAAIAATAAGAFLQRLKS
jgi:uncharacterized membrane protein